MKTVDGGLLGEPSRLERHRLAFIARGRKGGYLRVSELDRDDMMALSAEVFSWFGRKRDLGEGEPDPYQTYLEVLTDWGIICPHPEELRSPGGSGVAHDVDRTPYRSFTCGMCGCPALSEGPWSPGRGMVGPSSHGTTTPQRDPRAEP